MTVFNAPVTVTATSTGLTDLGTAVGASLVRSCDVRVANIGAADANIDLYLLDPAGTNSHYRHKNLPVEYNTANSSIDLEWGYILMAGWKFQVRASAGSTLAVTVTYTENAAS